MQIDPQLFEALRKSRWKLIISETGLGVPLQDALTRTAGASEVLLGGVCPYSKDVQRHEADRAISHEAVLQTAVNMMSDLSEGYKSMSNPPDPHSLAILAVSGCHREPDYMQDSHASLVLLTTSQIVHLHYRIPNSKTRDEAINISGKVSEWVIQKALLHAVSLDAWLKNPPEGALIDVLDYSMISERGNQRSLGLEHKLLLCTKDNPMVYHNGGLHRVTDYLRKYDVLFRGSFNPPTQVHEHIAGMSSIMEVSLTNARKGEISLKEAVHRAKMLDAIGLPTMFTKDRPLFADVVALMQEQNDPIKEYALGFDTYNAIHDPQFALTDEQWNLLKQQCFHVYGPESCKLVQPDLGHDLRVEREYTGTLDVRSSEVRKKITLGVPVYDVHPDVLWYIDYHRLYQDEPTTAEIEIKS